MLVLGTYSNYFDVEKNLIYCKNLGKFTDIDLKLVFVLLLLIFTKNVQR